MFYKNLLNLRCIQGKVRLNMNKNEKYFSLPNHPLAKNLIIVSGIYERMKGEKIEFVIKFVGIIVAIVFI